MQLGFAKSNQIPLEEKWVWPWARGAPKNLAFLFNVSAIAVASDFKVCIPLGFAKAHHIITPRGKVGLAWARELPKIRRFPFNIYTIG